MKKLIQIYFLSVGSLLFATGVLKIWSAGGDAAVLRDVDGVFGVELRQLYLYVGLAELLVVGYLLGGRRDAAKCFLLLYLGMGFATYRMSRWWLDIPEPCSCLGSATDWLGRFEAYVDPVLLGFNIYLIAVSVALLFGRRALSPISDSLAGERGKVAQADAG